MHTWLISFRLWNEKKKKTTSPLAIAKGPHSISVIYIFSTKKKKQATEKRVNKGSAQKPLTH